MQFISVFNYGVIEMAKNHIKSLRETGISTNSPNWAILYFIFKNREQNMKILILELWILIICRFCGITLLTH